MEILIIIVSVSFLAGAASCYLFLRWYQSAEIKGKVSELQEAHISKKLNLGGGVFFYRPHRLGKGQEGSKGKLHGISEINIIEHDGSVEIFGAWNRNGKNQIDPQTMYLPTSLDVIVPDRLIEFGKYFVDLGNKKNRESENA